MTTPFGGFTQIAVGPQPIQVCPPLGRGQSVTIYNQDQNNVVTLGTTSDIQQNATNGVPLQPLTPGTFPAAKAIYAVAPAGTAALVIIPEGGVLNPSPAQIAAQIAAQGLATAALQTQQETTIPTNIANTGVPATLSSLIGTFNAGINASWGATTFTFTTGGGYEITFQPSTPGNCCITDVQITHIDPSNNTTFVERFTVSTAGGLGNIGAIIRGNLYGNRIQVQGQTCTQAFINGIFGTPPTVSGFTAAVYSRPYVEASKPKVIPLAFDGGLIEAVNVAVAANAASQVIGVLQPYSGMSSFSVESTTGGGFNVFPWVSAYSVGGGLTRLYPFFLGQTGGANVANLYRFALDQRLHQLQLNNLSATVAGAVHIIGIAEDYI